MVVSNQFEIISGDVVDHVMAMKSYSGKKVLVFSLIFKINIYGQVICYFKNVVTLVYRNITKQHG